MLEEKVKSEEVSLETDKITIYVVRHGSYTGSCMDDSGLTDLGRKQAHEVGRKIREDLLEKEGSIDDAIEKAIILTSPTPRCIETRDLILEEIYSDKKNDSEIPVRLEYPLYTSSNDDLIIYWKPTLEAIQRAYRNDKNERKYIIIVTHYEMTAALREYFTDGKRRSPLEKGEMDIIEIEKSSFEEKLDLSK